MSLRNALLTAAALLLSSSVVPALAYDDGNNSYNYHNQFHDRLFGQHEGAHDEGFESRGEHRGYHHALRDRHEDAHEYQSAPQYYFPRRQYRFYRAY
jgi:hypothetical protein